MHRGERVVEKAFYVEASGLKRQVTFFEISHDEVMSQRVLTGEAALGSRLTVKSPSDGREFPLETVTVSISALPLEEEKRPGPPIDDWMLPAIVIPGLHNSGFFATCALNVWVHQAQFDSAWDLSGEQSVVGLRISFGSDKDPTPVQLMTENGHGRDCAVWARASQHEVTVDPGGAGGRKRRLRECRDRAIDDALRDQYVGTDHWSQVGAICHELAAGVAHIDDENERAIAIEKVRELLVSARQCFRGYDVSLYSRDKTAFLAQLEQADKDKCVNLATAYDTLWKHYRLADAVSKGQSADGPEKDDLRCSDTEIESVARDYVALKDIRSATLEHILMDSLMYSECRGTAQRLYSGVAVNGQLQGAPLVARSAWHVFKTQTRSRCWELTSEVVKLATTYAIARLITQDEPVGTWVVVSAFTLFRWFRRILLWRELTPHLRLKELHEQMNQANEILGRSDFNARDLRHFIHALTPLGCRFSPWVLHLLDRRIAYGGSGSALS